MPESVQSKADDSAVEDESSYAVKLVDVPETVGDADLRSSLLETPATSPVTATPVYKGMTFKGMLMMAVCCGARFSYWPRWDYLACRLPVRGVL